MKTSLPAIPSRTERIVKAGILIGLALALLVLFYPLFILWPRASSFDAFTPPEGLGPCRRNLSL